MSSYNEQREKYLSKVLALHRSEVPKGDILKEVPITRRTMDRWIERYALKKRTTKQYSTEKRKKYYDEVIRLHFENGYGEDTIARFIPVGHTTIGRWIANFVEESGNISVPKVMKKPQDQASTQELSSDVQALQKRVKELEAQLRQAEIKAEFYDEMINVAEAKFKIPIRKKAGAKQ